MPCCACPLTPYSWVRTTFARLRTYRKHSRSKFSQVRSLRGRSCRRLTVGSVAAMLVAGVSSHVGTPSSSYQISSVIEEPHSPRLQFRLPNAQVLIEPINTRIVASLDRKRLGADFWGGAGSSIRGVFDEETRRKPLAFAADAVR